MTSHRLAERLRQPRPGSRSGAASGETCRVLGPYQEGSRWRVVQICDGKRTARTVSSRQKALQIIHELRHPPVDRQPRTLATALREYDAYLRLERRLAPASCAHAQRTLRAFFTDDELPIASVTVAMAQKLARFEHAQARRIPRRYALSTRYAVLGHAFRFFDWAKGRYVETNPFAGVRPTGLTGSAPAPLSLDQARILSVVTLHRAAHDAGALGALLVLVMGLRSGQVLPLRVSDIDMAGRCLRLSDAGGQARWLPVPEVLVPSLRAAVQGKPPDALLLGAGRTGGVRPRNFLWRAVQRLTQQARVSPTCPRTLRALHGKLAVTARRVTARIANTIPTENQLSQVSARPAGPPGSPVRVLDLLGLSVSITQTRLDAVLSVLTPQQLADLSPQLGLAETPAPTKPRKAPKANQPKKSGTSKPKKKS